MVALPDLWIVNIFAFIACIAVNGVGGSGKFWGESIGDISDRYNSYITPGGGAFGIWSIIYILLTIFIVYQALPTFRKAPAISAIGNKFWMTCAFNGLWIFVFTEGSVAAMIVSSLVLVFLLTTLLWIYTAAGLWQETRESLLEVLCIDVCFSIYSGWVCCATIIGFTVDLIALGYDGDGQGDRWAIGMLGIALIIFSFVSITKQDPAFVAVLAWASFFIAQKPDDDLNSNALRTGAYIITGCSATVSLGVVGRLATSKARRDR
eukprot:CAMPEP_0118656628 /NCGR_PEP_ID=MMETSP0785-20121206/13586_1 /TAXON_ID=91992 /ORGANISM="Bolidomonas pacifica, Strain CCMP 1866" /LENGTH=263 /DNA_ID=CAMNT_0006549491 /DNA_START=281 /DNA_END=1069 /DNA_ORIENTATION=-